MTSASDIDERKRIRRRVLMCGAFFSFGMAGLGRRARAARLESAQEADPAAVPPGPRSLALDNLHTGEKIQIVYAVGAQFEPRALTTLNHFLRDHYSGDVGVMDPRLFDLLHTLRQTLGTSVPFEVISGYRSPATNARLRATRGGGVASHSLHMQGMAIDIRLPGTGLGELRDAALALAEGGVGFYPREQFVHVDTGRVRHW